MLEGVLELTADIDSSTQGPVSSEKETDIDEAFGLIPEAFVPSKNNANEENGTEASLLRQTERKISWTMMSVMLVVYSALSLLIGMVLDPLAAIPLLLLLASLRFHTSIIYTSHQPPTVQTPSYQTPNP